MTKGVNMNLEYSSSNANDCIYCFIRATSTTSSIACLFHMQDRKALNGKEFRADRFRIPHQQLRNVVGL